MIAGAVAILVALAWWFLVAGAGLDHGTDAMGMGPMAPPPLLALVLMWWLMMVAMMLPAAAPTILLYARVREQRGGSAGLVPTWVFALAYLAVWLAFSVVAALAQRALAGQHMSLPDATLASFLLIAAGAYQLSPLKRACLRQCRSPVQFLSRHWRPGVGGALRLGLLHGAYCVGCCWLLMALLFVVGVMNFAWIAGLTVIVAVEKLMPRGEWIGQLGGIALIGWGLARLAF